MPVITAVDANGQQHMVTCAKESVGKHVNLMKNKRLLNIKVNSD